MITLKILDITFKYRSLNVLRNITFEAREGEVISIIGPNGSGKTTLLKCILNILKPNKGTIYIDPYGNIADLPISKKAKLIAYTPQVESPIASFTVFEFVLLGRKPYIGRTYTQKDLEIAERIINELGLKKLALRRITELSGGEWRKVLIARALAQNPKVLLLDEPTNHLDLKHQISVLELIRKISKNKRVLILMAMHDINLAIRYSDKIIALKNGKIIYCGKPTDVTKDLIKKLYEIDVEIIKTNNNMVVVIPKTPLSN